MDEEKRTQKPVFAPGWVSSCAILGLLVVGILALYMGFLRFDPVYLIASALAFGCLVFAHILYSRF